MKKQLRIFSYFLLIALLTTQGCKKETDDTEQPCGSPFVVDLGADVELEEGTSIALDATVQNATYVWSTGETTPVINVDTTGIYWVLVTTCYGSESDTVAVNLRYKTIKMSTLFGDIHLWLYHQTPLHRDNFLTLAADHFYDGLIFHRVVQNFVIQGGDPDGTGYGGPGYTIPAEIFAPFTHVYGALGAARLGNDVNPEKESNGSQFYIVCDPNGEPGLNGEYTVFGRVFNGLDVVQTLAGVDVDEFDRPLEDVVMNAVTVVYFTAGQLESEFGFTVPQ